MKQRTKGQPVNQANELTHQKAHALAQHSHTHTHTQHSPTHSLTLTRMSRPVAINALVIARVMRSEKLLWRSMSSGRALSARFSSVGNRLHTYTAESQTSEKKTVACGTCSKKSKSTANASHTHTHTHSLSLSHTLTVLLPSLPHQTRAHQAQRRHPFPCPLSRFPAGYNPPPKKKRERKM